MKPGAFRCFVLLEEKISNKEDTGLEHCAGRGVLQLKGGFINYFSNAAPAMFCASTKQYMLFHLKIYCSLLTE